MRIRDWLWPAVFLFLWFMLVYLVYGEDDILITRDSSLIATFELACSIYFYDSNGKVGVLTWGDGIFKFEGNAEESAMTFFNEMLKHLWDEWAESKCPCIVEGGSHGKNQRR